MNANTLTDVPRFFRPRRPSSGRLGPFSVWIGIHAIFGAFLFGIITPREPARALAEQVRKPLDNIVLILTPVFFIITGLGVNIGGLSGRQYVELAFIIAVACAGKLLGAIVPARIFKLPWRESRALGLLMNTGGLTGLIVLVRLNVTLFIMLKPVEVAARV